MLLEHLNLRAADVHDAFQATYNSGYEHPLYQAWNMANEATAICLTSQQRDGAKISSAPQQYLKISRYHRRNGRDSVRRLMNTSVMVEVAESLVPSVPSLSPGDAASPQSVNPFVSPLQQHHLFADSSPVLSPLGSRGSVGSVDSVSSPFDFTSSQSVNPFVPPLQQHHLFADSSPSGIRGSVDSVSSPFDFKLLPQATSTPPRHSNDDDDDDGTNMEGSPLLQHGNPSFMSVVDPKEFANMSVSNSESPPPAQDVSPLAQAVLWDDVDLAPAVLAGRTALAERHMPVTPSRPRKGEASRFKATDVDRFPLKMATEYVIPDFIFFVNLASNVPGKRFQYPIVLEEIKPIPEGEELRGLPADRKFYSNEFFKMEIQCFTQAMLAFTEYPKLQAHWDAIFVLMVVADRFKMLKVKRPAECPQTKAECEKFVEQNLETFHDQLSMSVLPAGEEGFSLLEPGDNGEYRFSKEWFEVWRVVGQECELEFNFDAFYYESG